MMGRNIDDTSRVKPPITKKYENIVNHKSENDSIFEKEVENMDKYILSIFQS